MSTVVAERPTTAVESASEAGNLAIPEPVRLAAPYFGNWRQVPAQSPRGYWANSQLNNWTGGVMLQMGSLGDHQPNPLIGWAWAGWKNPYVSAQRGELFTLRVSTDQVITQGYGGHSVPRAFLTLQPRGGAPIEKSVVIGSNGSYHLGVRAPSNGTFTLGVSFNIRSVRQGHAYPFCRINGTLSPVTQWERRFAHETPQARAAGLPEGVDRVYQPEAREFTDEELAEQLAALDDEQGVEIPAGPEAFEDIPFKNM